ncbi:hypothetical protein NC653_028604 [Populus alba x Populus x berolinensis]|uniref:Uncharacterized protein n=1 Tax=Populus alba x Populus x berolinensis TaxID=444605 RepID=A0AAD6M198_9ROSI|nr:hypothetical protein NC653_028604 [Populus alba x Populus x berolinensis]
MFLQEPVLYVASAALRCLVLFDELRKPDPNREASKKALEHKKEITKHLGRPFIQTNPYEFKFLCDNGDGGHEIKIAMRDLGGLVGYCRDLGVLVKIGHPIPQAAICTLFSRLCLGMLAIP